MSSSERFHPRFQPRYARDLLKLYLEQRNKVEFSSDPFDTVLYQWHSQALNDLVDVYPDIWGTNRDDYVPSGEFCDSAPGYHPDLKIVPEET